MGEVLIVQINTVASFPGFKIPGNHFKRLKKHKKRFIEETIVVETGEWSIRNIYLKGQTVSICE